MGVEKEIRVPDIGDFESVEVIEVLVSSGDSIQREDSLITIESDKASMEIPSPFSGVVEKIAVAVGDRVSQDSLIALVTTEDAEAATTEVEPAGRTTTAKSVDHSTPQPAAAQANPCERTATLQFHGCKNEVRDDTFLARAICTNISDSADRAECMAEAHGDRSDGFEECGDVFDARTDLCGDLGEFRYDPDFDPADFTDVFADNNPNFPLTPGNWWVYEGGGEVITVQVLDETKNVEDVTCIVVNDVVEDEGDVVEDTDDWYGQALNDDVWYCGELARDFETTEGDDPEGPELVEIEGSFKHGRDGSKAGIIMFADPEIGIVYRQEWSPSNAEDVGEIAAVGYGFRSGYDEIDGVVAGHRAIINHFCSADDCLVTIDSSPLEPGPFELKFYANGIGMFLEVKPDDGEFIAMTDCSFAACATIP